MNKLEEEATAIAGEPVICLSDLNAKLGVHVRAEQLEHLGIKPAATVRRGIYFKLSDFPQICTVLSTHLVKAAKEFCEAQAAAKQQEPAA